MIKNYLFLMGAVILFTNLSFSQVNLWQNTTEPSNNNRQIVPENYRTVSVDFGNLKDALQQAPDEKFTTAASSNFIFTIPAPDGTNWQFSVVESSIMEAELQAKFPEIRTFLGQGLGDKAAATLRMDFGPNGFHAQVLAPGGSFFIDPYAPGTVNTYICYSRESFYKTTNKQFTGCQTIGSTEIEQERVIEEKHIDPKKGKKPGNISAKATNGSNLRTYRLALACTGEYAQYHGGTVPLVMAAMVTSMNRVNGVFERDMSLRMIMVDDNDLLIFLNAGSDPYSNTSGDLNANQTTCNNIIGLANYDIGHLFGTGGGGVAQLNSPCGTGKARGLTGQSNPIGDPFDIDYVAHEMGHQWGANHTQNNSCNRASSAAYEPGSASTIMGYAGICAPNLQSNSDDHFHNRSFNEMYNFSVAGSGNSCAVTTSTGNTPPSLTMPAGGFTIPVQTPFELTASATDPNGDLLTYCWEQYNLGPATAAGDNNLTNPSGTAPIFRSWSPTTDPTRVFPRISDLVNNTTVIGELLPTYTRDLTFRCTVRDNRAGGGGVTDGQVAFEATSTAGPFIVTAPNTAVTWTGNTTQNVTWNVANTTASPVSCSNVDIYLSTDGGFNYPTLLASGVPNNGSANITVPNISTTQARVKVKASNNIFFDISNQNFTIQLGTSLDYDAALISINSPTGDLCETTFTPEITIQNLGSITLTSLTVLYNVDGGTNQTFNWTGSLATGVTTNIVLPNVTTTSGNHVFNVTLQNPNGQSDENNGNDNDNSAFSIITVSGISLPVTNNFTGAFPGTGWEISNPDAGITWNQQTLTNDGNCAGGQSARMDFYNYNNGIGQTDDLILPWINLSASTNPELSFSRAHARYSATYSDQLLVQISADCGLNWTTLWDEAGADLATAPDQTGPYDNPACNEWITETIDLTAYSGQNVQIRFRAINGFGNNLHLDNINVSEPCEASMWYQDLDEDTYGNPNVSQLACDQPTGYVSNNTDCDDMNPNVNPGSSEIACNGIDDNCNNQIDENDVYGCMNPTSCNYNALATCDDGSCITATTWYEDLDGDTYGNQSAPLVACAQPVGYVLDNSDCDDSNANVNPGAVEIPCNSLDDNCNDQIDENSVNGCTNPAACNYNPSANCDDGSCVVSDTWYTDSDGDGFGADEQGVEFCGNPCDGTISVTISSGGWLDEISWTLSDNSNNVILQGGPYPNTQNGGTFNASVNSTNGPFSFFIETQGQFNDNTPTYTVASGAGYVLATGTRAGGTTFTIGDLSCSFVANNTDCDETDSSINPIASEIPCNGVDENCNNQIDENNVSGCTNPLACNYNPLANCDDGSCDLISCIDCNGDFNGTAFLDNCNTCVGGNTGLSACVADCNGDFGGTAFLDNCNTCVGGNTGLSACVADCNGDFGGTAFLDNCNTCVGGNTGLSACVADCNGDFGGTAFLDNCNTCVGGNTGLSACVADCNGDFGGTAFLDNCNTCVGGNTGLSACVADCNGDFGGTAFLDDCNTCVGGNTGLEACVICAPGFFLNGTECSICPVGFYCPGDGNSYPCPAGTFNNLTGAIACMSCPAGTFSDIVGSATCTACPSGTYQDQIGATACLDCPNGSTSDVGSVSCTFGCSLSLTGSTTSASAGFADGSATVIASGGEQPYTYLWNDSFEQTAATALGLFPGTYTCIVTDVNDCTESIELTVGLQSEVPQTQVRAQFCNTSGYVLSDVISCDIAFGASNYRWEFTPQGGSPLPEYTRGSSNYNVRLSWVSGTQLGVTYEVRVKAFVNGQWGDYGPMCTITTTSEVPLTEVHPNWTPNNPNTNTAYGYCGVVAANGVAGAAAYGWELTGPNTLFAETSSYNLVLSSVVGLQLNTTYQVRVRLLMSGNWGEYGPSRPINLGMPPATVIIASQCNTTRTLNQAVAAVNVCGAQYTFRFQHPTEVERTKVRNVYTCPLWQMNPALTPGETYQVSVSVTQGGISSGYGVACPITIAGPQAAGLASEVLTLKSLETGSMALFPNPNFGGEVKLMMDNLEEGVHNVNITVYDIFGKQISTEAFGYEGAELSHVLRFNSQLATGIYTVHIVIDGQSFAVERMVVK
jgi:hypothetical protein